MQSDRGSVLLGRAQRAERVGADDAADPGRRRRDRAIGRRSRRAAEADAGHAVAPVSARDGDEPARRRMLLEYARQHGCWIIEDDYDSEFRYGSRPLASLQGLDTAGQVIYVGSFGKTLFPGCGSVIWLHRSRSRKVSRPPAPSCIAKGSCCSRRCWPSSSRKDTSCRISARCARYMGSAARCCSTRGRAALRRHAARARQRCGCIWSRSCRKASTIARSRRPRLNAHRRAAVVGVLRGSRPCGVGVAARLCMRAGGRDRDRVRDACRGDRRAGVWSGRGGLSGVFGGGIALPAAAIDTGGRRAFRTAKSTRVVQTLP